MSFWNSIAGLQQQLTGTNSLRARFARGAVWSFVGNVTAALLQLGSFILVARYLGKRGFGELGIISSTVQTLGLFGGVALGITATKHVAEWRSSDAQRAGRMIGLCIVSGVIASGVLSLAMLAGAPLLAGPVFHAPALTPEVRIASVFLFFSALLGLQNAVLSGLEAFKALATVNFIRGVLRVPFVVFGARYFGLTGAVVGLLVGSVAGALISQWSVDRECQRAAVPVTYRHIWGESSALWHFSLPSLLSSILASLALWLANTLLVRQPNGYLEMGVFNAANQWRLAITFIPVVLNQVLLPILSDLHGRRDPVRLQRALQGSLIAITLLSLVPALGVSLFSKFIMKGYGPGFVEGWPVLVLVSLSAVPSAASSVLATLLLGAGRMWTALVLNCVWAVVFLGCIGLRIGHGAQGLAMAYLISYLLHVVLCMGYTAAFFRSSTLPSAAIQEEAAVGVPEA